MMRTRFAPSPTGNLHLGHAYAAKYASNLAKSNSGTFLLRFEDIDSTRVRQEYYQQIINDLNFIDIYWDAPPLKQSTRSTEYNKAINTLKDLNLIYPCYCSRKKINHELTQLANAPHGPEGHHYPEICKKLSAETLQSNSKNPNLIPSWRFNSEQATTLYPNLIFNDSIHGKVKVDPSLLGDIILSRKDISTSYHIAVVVDDAFQEITDVTRGEDLIYSTHIHRVLQQALDLPTPNYHHHKLILDNHGDRLAKRNNAFSLLDLKNSKRTKAEILSLISV